MPININEKTWKFFIWILFSKSSDSEFFFISDCYNKISTPGFISFSSVIKWWKIERVIAVGFFYFALVFTCMCEVFVLSAGKLYRLWGYSGSPVWCSDRSHQEEEARTVSPCGRGTGPQNQHAEGAGLPVYSIAAAHDRTAALFYWGPERKRPCLISSGLYMYNKK